MKPIRSLLVLIAALRTVQAQDILIGPGVRNGNFNGAVSAIDPRNFTQPLFWENLNGDQTANATRNNRTNTEGSRNAQLTHSTATGNSLFWHIRSN